MSNATERRSAAFTRLAEQAEKAIAQAQELQGQCDQLAAIAEEQKARRASLEADIAHQRAALLTPEGYRGVVAEALADEHERLVGENASLRTIVAAYDPLDVLLAAKALADCLVPGARWTHSVDSGIHYRISLRGEQGQWDAYLKVKKEDTECDS